MRLSARGLNRTTLARQLLLARERTDVVDALRRVVALQGQEPPSPYLALWNRIERFDPTELDRAIAEQRVLKATLMRVTQHVVVSDDYPAFHAAMQPTLRAARLNDRRFRRTGLTAADADGLLPEVLAFAREPRTNAQAEAWLDERLGETPKPGVWWAYRQYAPFVHAATGGSWSFGPRPAYVAAPNPTPTGDPAAALPVLLRRYLEGFGPASLADFAQFTMLVRPLIRAAHAAIAGGLRRVEGPAGEELWDVPDGDVPAEETEAPPRLLPMWDETLLAYADRSRTIPNEWRGHVTRKNGDVLPTLLVDGFVAGVWRPLERGIEATAFRRLTDEVWAALEAEARDLRALLAKREAVIYRRYWNWWQTLPAAEIRLLAAD